MADYKIRIFNILSCSCLKYKVIVLIKISLNFTCRIIDAGNYGFYCICVEVRNLNISISSVESHYTFNTNLLLHIKGISTGHTENVRCIKFSVPITVKITISIFYK